MSYDIYYTIRKNKKERYEIDTLFFGKKLVFDYPCISKFFKNAPLYFDSYSLALDFMNKNKFSFKDFHIRKTISTGGGVSHTDYIYRRR